MTQISNTASISDNGANGTDPTPGNNSGSADGEIDVDEIYRYVSEKVALATEGRQHPKLNGPSLVGRILLGRGSVRRRK